MSVGLGPLNPSEKREVLLEVIKLAQNWANEEYDLRVANIFYRRGGCVLKLRKVGELEWAYFQGNESQALVRLMWEPN